MRIRRMLSVLAVALLFTLVIASSPVPQMRNSEKAAPLILEKEDGERRLWRPIEGDPGPQSLPSLFILKVDPRNGSSSHLVFGTEDLDPGQQIETHSHPAADEILFVQTGTAEVHLGSSVRKVHGGATVFIPANTSIAARNISSDSIHLIFVFSAPGFEEFMREESVREGEKVTPLSKAEDAEIQKKHAHAVVYQ